MEKSRLKSLCCRFCPYLVFVLVSIFILWTQLQAHSVYIASDYIFHMNQFYESATQIRTGNLSWFLTLFGFGQTGRIVNAVYSPIFSYLVGGLLLLLGTWYRLSITLDFLVLFLGGTFMYHLLHQCHIRRINSSLISILYMGSFPIAHFLHGEAFSDIGNAIMPLVILLGIKMWKKHKVLVVPTAILLAVIVQIHLLSCLIAILVLIPFALISWKRTNFSMKWLSKAGECVLLFFGLSLNIWATIFDVFGSSYVLKPFANLDMGNSYYTFCWWHHLLNPFSMPYLFVFALLIILLIVEFNKLPKGILSITLLGLIFLALSSKLIPWTFISRIFTITSQTIQIPLRFLGVATILLLFTLAYLIQNLNHNKELSRLANVNVYNCVLIFLTLLSFSSVTIQHQQTNNGVKAWNSSKVYADNRATYHPQATANKIRESFNDTKRLSSALKYAYKVVPDYLPSNKKMSAQKYKKIKPYHVARETLSQKKIVNSKNVRGFNQQYVAKKYPNLYKHIAYTKALNLTWRQSKKNNKKKTIIPLVKYTHTHVTLNHHPLKHVKINSVGAIVLHPKVGHNSITVTYHPNPFWYLAMFVMVLSWLGLIIVTLGKIALKNESLRKTILYAINPKKNRLFE